LVSSAAVIAAVGAGSARAGCAALIPRSAAAPGSARDVTATDLIALRTIGPLDGSNALAPSPFGLSPDGRRLAFVISRDDPATGEYCQALLVMDLDTSGGPRVIDRGGDRILQNLALRGSRISAGWPAVVTPRWSRDGRAVGYLKRSNGVTRVWVSFGAGTPAVPVSPAASDVLDWRWDRDGASIVFSTEPGRRAESEAIAREGRQGFLYDARMWPGVGVAPLPAGTLPVKNFVADLGGRVRAANDGDDVPANGATALMPVTDSRGWRASAVSDGTSPLSPTRLIVTPPGRPAQPCRAQTCRDGLVSLWWSDGAVLFLRREGWDQEDMALYRWRPGTAAPHRILLTHQLLLGCAFAVRLICTAEESAVPPHVVMIDIASGRMSTVFVPNPEFTGVRLGSVRRLRLRNAFGLESWADLVTPPGFDGQERLPTIIVQYRSRGFLRGGTGDDYPVFLFAARGYAVLSLEQPHNVAYARPDLPGWDAVNAYSTHDWRERQSLYSSLEAAIDAGVTAGVVDRKRIGITGLSDGATTVQYALIHSQRFAAAAISTCCIEPKTVMTQGIGWADWNRTVQGFPPASRDDPDFWRPVSLSVNAARIDTPLLMQLADSEYLQSLEAFTALRENGKPVEMYIFPDEYHNKVSPEHRLAVWTRSLDWFDFWLLHRVDPDPAKAAQYRRWDAMRAKR